MDGRGTVGRRHLAGLRADARHPWWNEPVTWLFVILVILLLAVGFLLVLGLLGGLPPAEPDLRPDTQDGEPAFDVVLRGYRMDEVDAQLATMQDQIDLMQAELDGRRADGPA